MHVQIYCVAHNTIRRKRNVREEFLLPIAAHYFRHICAGHFIRGANLQACDALQQIGVKPADTIDDQSTQHVFRGRNSISNIGINLFESILSVCCPNHQGEEHD